MQTSEPKSRTRRKRAETPLIFDPTQKVPDAVLDAIVDEWLVTCLVGQFLRENGFVQCRFASGLAGSILNRRG